ncbi:hypothetical protein [Clostridium sp. ATCC 25772]|uniref:hypothetical protein n=1 Tax=Clostridium sp. ATCC 25772 TaxID=1676991 RepID=UPI000AB95375|nr:hypothetical protein [Clostridium sp. ATCC 25772]
MKRKIKENLNKDIKVERFFEKSVYTYTNEQIKLLAYYVSVIKGEVELLVHNDYR